MLLCLQQSRGRVSAFIGKEAEAEWVRPLSWMTFLGTHRTEIRARQNAFQAFVSTSFTGSIVSSLYYEPKKMELREFLFRIL